jgi:STE24 endopeptidase
MNVKKYNLTKIWCVVINGVIFFIALTSIILSGFGMHLEKLILKYSSSEYLSFIIFVLVLSIILALINFPINFYSEYFLEKKYNLSNQTLAKYLTDKLKALLVSALIGVPLLIVLYYLLKNFPDEWWLFFSIVLFFFTVLMAQIFPIFILPLFFKLKPIEDAELINEIKKISEKTNFKFSKIYSFDLSSKTKKANAALTGIGNSKKIIIGDTLLNLLSINEIITVLAHEIGHFKLKHIPKSIFLSTLNSFLTIYIISELYKFSISEFGYNSVSQISAFPFLIFWSSLISLIVAPIFNFISRMFEYQADNFAVQLTGKPEVFKSALDKLYDKNLSDKEPHPLVELVLYSHPSYKKRIGNIEKYISNSHSIFD